ncbi:MAG: aldo/keto reductase [Saprospiraceae bacterium]
MLSAHPIPLVLGTALWGWTVDEPTCHRLLSHFYRQGGRMVDTATNYPINKQPADFRRAENILARWCQREEVTDLQVIVKVGSVDNLFTPDNNLSPAFLLMALDYYRNLFGSNLHTFMIHGLKAYIPF